MDGQLLRAYHLMTREFGGRKDRVGQPYEYHCMRVCFLLGDDATIDERCAGILHDILEDTTVTQQDLYNAGFSKTTISLVEIVTRRKGETYGEFITRCGQTEGSVKLKLCDLADNTDLDRHAYVGPSIQNDLHKRYSKAIHTLSASKPLMWGQILSRRFSVKRSHFG